MDDYISREAAIALTDQHCFETSYDAVWMEEELRNLPAAEVRPVVHGKWVHGREVGREYLGDCLVGIFYDRWTCSECGHIVDDHAYSRINYNFCPNCGADMRKPNLDATKEEPIQVF